MMEDDITTRIKKFLTEVNVYLNKILDAQELVLRMNLRGQVGQMIYDSYLKGFKDYLDYRLLCNELTANDVLSWIELHHREAIDDFELKDYPSEELREESYRNHFPYEEVQTALLRFYDPKVNY